MTSITEIYHGWVASTIDEEGISMPHAIAQSGKDTTVYALAMPMPEAYRFVLSEIALKLPDEIIFGFDRYTKPGQGTELGDLIAGVHIVTNVSVRPFIIEYQHAPRIVKPICWNNSWWNAALAREMLSVIQAGAQ